MLREKSVRKECVQILSKILPEFNLDFTQSVIDERDENGFYNEEPNITYPKDREGKNEPFFVAEIGVIDGDKNTFFKAKFYVWGDVTFFSGYKSQIAKEVAKDYYTAVKKNNDEVKRKRSFELVYV